MTGTTAAACSTGSWQQKWDCGWRQPPSTAVQHAGFLAGHNAVWLIVAVIVAVMIFVRGARGHRAAMSGTGPR